MKYPELFDDTVDNASGFESHRSMSGIRMQSLGNNDAVYTDRKFFNIPKYENNVKHVHNESVDVKNKSKHDQANNVDCKREKNLKVHSFLRNLGIRIMKVFQVKDS